MMDALCRDCLTDWRTPGAARCPACGSPRVLAHPELFDLALAHLDADAFYASVEKADDPALRDRPVIVGGGNRGVVTTACYIARLSGVRSAMPMFKARRLCPEAVVIRPRMARYAEVSAAIRARLEALSPAVEPLSLDEAWIDLTGTARLHRAAPAILLARLQAEIERELSITVSIGLSHAKYLAKIASDRMKPRGFSLIGRAETLAVIAPLPLAVLPGIGPTTARSLARAGFRTIADVQSIPLDALAARVGELAPRLHAFARGVDGRTVSRGGLPKSISNETTFAEDHGSLEVLKPILWRMAEKVSARAKAQALAGRIVTLKLKRADHRVLTRRATLSEPTQLADRLYRTTLPLLIRDLPAGPFRLLGLALSGIAPAAPESADLADPGAADRASAERAADVIRTRFGERAIYLGRAVD